MEQDSPTIEEILKALDAEPITEKITHSENEDWFICPVCGKNDQFIVEARCVTCFNCGWSKCDI